CPPPPRSASTRRSPRACRASVTSASPTPMRTARASTNISPGKSMRRGRRPPQPPRRDLGNAFPRQSAPSRSITPTLPNALPRMTSRPWRARSATCTRPKSCGRIRAGACACAARPSRRSRRGKCSPDGAPQARNPGIPHSASLHAGYNGGTMANETIQLAEYAAGLKYKGRPPPAVQRAQDPPPDPVAPVLFGYDLPWSRIIVDYAKRNGAGGRSRILGAGEVPVHAPAAALANGAIAHAFEMDNLTQPNSGSHPGATTFSAALAVAQERGLSGRETIAATVAGFETMIRIGRATKHSNERRGFHAPGTTGPLGAAVACGPLMQFDAERMTNALGISASTAGGLLEFARSGTGAMVKRLHLGRAAEGGVLAASLAADGFTGPK